MNKLSLAIALGTGLTLSAVSSTAFADKMTTTPAVIQTLATPELTASQFNALFHPINDAPAITSDIKFFDSPVSGALRSQVFAGGIDAKSGMDATGLYAYAYQLSVNNVTNSLGEPVHIDSASWQFNATPTGTDFAGVGKPTYAYVIKDHAIGNLIDPAAAGASVRVPATLSWSPGTKIGAIRADYVDPVNQTQPLTGGDSSATFVVISKQPWSATFQHAGILSSNPQEGAPAVYAAAGGAISPVPVPEPATLLVWAGMAGAAVLVRRVRKARTA